MTRKLITVTFDLEANDGADPTPEDVARYLAIFPAPPREARLHSWSLSHPTVYMEPPRVVIGMEG